MEQYDWLYNYYITALVCSVISACMGVCVCDNDDVIHFMDATAVHTRLEAVQKVTEKLREL